MTRLEFALAEIVAARKYTVELLDAVPVEDWFRQPREGVTHIAWQVGHLAIAQYNLALKRIRGVLPGDAELIPADFAQWFGKESVPRTDTADHPTPKTIRRACDRVYEQVLAENARLTDNVLDEPSSPPHRIVHSKLDALLWCARHEMLHAGQIGLLRRLLGHPSVW